VGTLKTKGVYEIVDLGQLQVKIDSLDMAEVVVYRSLANKKLWVRHLLILWKRLRQKRGRHNASHILRSFIAKAFVKKLEGNRVFFDEQEKLFPSIKLWITKYAKWDEVV
jgi:hypothetical protein